MTVIAWDGAVLAADRRTNDAGFAWTTTKIIKAPDGSLLGATGNSSICRSLRAWWVNGADPEKWPDKENDCILLVVRPDKRVSIYMDGPAEIEVHQQFAAIGSGRDYAIAAMHYGKSAREAVELACTYDTACGNGIDVLTL